MRVRIHRGTREIGGTCIELESAGCRILLDLGLPLDAAYLASSPLPDIEGLRDGSASLLAIVLCHGHRDHWGLIPKVNPQIPLIMGKATESIIRAAADFVPDAVKLNAAQYLEHGKSIQLGPFTILPRLVDHSGFDAYAMTVETGGKRLFYSGDLRAHGRKGVSDRRKDAIDPWRRAIQVVRVGSGQTGMPLVRNSWPGRGSSPAHGRHRLSASMGMTDHKRDIPMKLDRLRPSLQNQKIPSRDAPLG